MNNFIRNDMEGIKVSRVNKNNISDVLVFNLVNAYKRFNQLRAIQDLSEDENIEYIILQDRVKFISLVLTE